MPLVEKVAWAALKSLAELEKEIQQPYVYRIKSECGQISDTARFSKEEKQANKIYCYTHHRLENIQGIGKISLGEK